MRFSPLPILATVTAVQICLALGMSFVSWKASAAHQRNAELYAEHLSTLDSSPVKSNATPFVRLASKEAARADLSFRYSTLLSLGILVLAGVQFWLVADLWRGGGTTKHLVSDNSAQKRR